MAKLHCDTGFIGFRRSTRTSVVGAFFGSDLRRCGALDACEFRPYRHRSPKPANPLLQDHLDVTLDPDQ